MSTATYSLIYEGGIREGFDVFTVRQRVGELLKLDGEQLDRLFSGRRTVLHTGLAEDDAVRYCARFNGLGMEVNIRADRAEAPARDISATPQQTDHAPQFEGSLRVLPFEFRGTGGEYFRIWIVNLLLSIVTLGIYSAWAKVRTQRYFYGNTRLDGSSFEYLGDPLKILKGRLIAFALLVLYIASDYFALWIAGLAFLLLIVLTPWIVRSGMRFRNHNSAWRGVRFGFDGTLGGAFKAWLLWVGLGFVTFGLLMPYALFQQLRYSIGGARFGTARFTFDGGVGTVYKICLAAAGCVFAGGLLFGIVGVFAPMVSIGLMLLGYLCAYALFRAWMTNYRFNHSRCAGHRFEADYRFGSYLRLVLINTVLMICTLGLFYPWAKVRTARYASEHTYVLADGDLDRFAAVQREEVSATGGEVGELFDVDLGF